MTTIGPNPTIQQLSDRTQLEERQRELLIRIGQLQTVVDPGQDQLQRIRIAKTQYNRIVKSINASRAKLGYDPINKLPPELFSQIIGDVTSDGAGLDMIFPSRTYEARISILALTLVSRKRMEFITGTPIYWAFIVLDEKRPDLFSLVSTFLHLSRGLPLTLYIKPSRAVEALIIEPELLEHRTRITHIVFDTIPILHPPVSRVMQSIFWNLMGKLTPLPQLATLSYSGPSVEDSAARRLLELFPTLTEIRGIALSQDMLQSFITRNCKYIQIDHGLELSLPILQNNGSLDTVVCYNAPDPVSESPPKGNSATELLNLKTLNLGHLSISLSIKIPKGMTKLVSLSVRGYFSASIQLLKNLDYLHKLQVLGLQLWIDGPQTSEDRLPTSLSPNTNVQYLTLRMTRRVPGQDVPSENREFQKQFTGLVCQSVPLIHNLFLVLGQRENASNLSQFLDLKEVSRLSYLQSLHLRSDLPLDTFELPPCEVLRLSCPRLRISRFPNRRVKQFHIVMSLGPTSRLDLESHLESWSAIEKLTIPANFMAHCHRGFDSLRKVAINGYITNERGGFTRFCRNLAVYPTFCPLLEALSTDICLEWDIFFIMLERRLIWSTTGTKALKSVALPGNTPRRLLRLVCEILQGQLADRPSNFDLSLSEKISIFLDTTILDCIVCISSGAKCSFPSPSINPGLELIQRMITRAKDLPIYPENEEDILRSWEARAKVFEDVLNLSRFRNDNCDIFLHPVKLDQFSCVDVDF